jgi:hypothetical protein
MTSQLTRKKESLLALNIVSTGFTNDDDEDEGDEHYEDIKLEVCVALFYRHFIYV